MSQSEASLTEFKLIECNETKHAVAILEILNEAILNSTALYDYQPRTLKNMQTWFATKREQNFPILGIINPTGELLGFTHSGTIQQAGFKFGCWLDAAFYQLTLTTPLHPQDG